MKFRKKPVVIEAVQFVETPGSADAVRAFLGEPDKKCGFVRRDNHYYPFFEITTLEGVMEAHLGDWIIKGVAGEFYPCKPDIFAKTYEQVE